MTSAFCWTMLHFFIQWFPPKQFILLLWSSFWLILISHWDTSYCLNSPLCPHKYTSCTAPSTNFPSRLQHHPSFSVELCTVSFPTKYRLAHFQSKKFRTDHLQRFLCVGYVFLSSIVKIVLSHVCLENRRERVAYYSLPLFFCSKWRIHFENCLWTIITTAYVYVIIIVTVSSWESVKWIIIPVWRYFLFTCIHFQIKRISSAE